MLGRIGLYARTLKHLEPRQWLYLPVRRVRPAVRPHTAAGMVLGGRALERLADAAMIGAPAAERTLERADAVVSGRLTFLNHVERLADVDWTRRHVSPLWTYHLHYFDYALDLARAYRQTREREYLSTLERLALGWIRDTEGGRGPGWEPYALSVRVTNWLKALAIMQSDMDPAAFRAIQHSVAQQLAGLARRIEWHLLGNHVLKNLCALVLGSLVYAGGDSGSWGRRARRQLAAQLREQFTPDGLHVERVPMYHALVLRDLLELDALMRASGEAVPPLRSLVPSAAAALACLTRPDGSLHPLQDSVEWVDAMEALPELALHAGAPLAPPGGAWELPAGGYHGWRDAAAGHAIVIDASGPAPVYQPGHSHCSLLSYELVFAGAPVVVDSGVHGYDGDPFREYVRSTRAHNTVSIAGRDQSDIWGTFRLAGRARSRTAASREADAFCFEGSCSPHFDARAVHARRIEGRGTTWFVTDRVVGANGASLESFIHLHPTFRCTIDGDVVTAGKGARQVRIEALGADSVRIDRGLRAPVQGWYCPEFGRADPQDVIVLRVEANEGRPFGYKVTGFE